MKRIKGGVLADGLNSAIAAVFNSFPNSTFSQNNGVILLTGVALAVMSVTSSLVC